MAAAALRQLVMQTIRRRIATGGQTSITGAGRTTMAQGHLAVRPYTSEVAAHQERTARLIRQIALAELGLHLAAGSICATSFAMFYYGPFFPRKRNT